MRSPLRITLIRTSALLLFVATRSLAQSSGYQDVPYLQDYSINYYVADSTLQLKSVYADRNGVVQVLSANGSLRPRSGQFQYPGTLEPDRAYRPMADKRITAMALADKQFVYLDNVAVLSNAWAGKLFMKHDLPNARLVCAAANPSAFVVSDGTNLKAFQYDKVLWEVALRQDQVKALRYEPAKNRVWVIPMNETSLSN